MKLKSAFLSLMAFAVVALCSAQCASAKKKQYVPERGDYTFRTELVTKMTEDFDDPQAADIITYVTNKQTTDTLHSEPIPLNPNEWRGFGEIHEDDINFDGFPDLQICLGPFNYAGNFTYDAYIWDNEAHKFVNVPEFSEIFDPELREADRQIVGSFRLDNTIDWQVWEWRDGKLVKVKEGSDDIRDITGE